MFETATNTIQQHLPAGEHRALIAYLIALGIAWVVLLVIRDFWCWFWKTAAIVNRLETINNRLETINHNLNCLHVTGGRCRAELSEANSKLERIADGVTAAPGKKQAVSAGSQGPAKCA
jgi:hypothetical protein